MKRFIHRENLRHLRNLLTRTIGEAECKRITRLIEDEEELKDQAARAITPNEQQVVFHGENGEQLMDAPNLKRSIVLDGRKTSVSLENEFWTGLREIAASQKIPLTTLLKQIHTGRGTNNMSSAIRVFLFNRVRANLPAYRSASLYDHGARAAVSA